jgi:hypothetical protein
MLLNEETREQYKDRLVKQLGIKQIGQGGYADIYEHPDHPNMVVKVSVNDERYDGFAMECMDIRGNPWLPKIYSRHKVKMEDDVGREVPAFIYFMEKLVPVEDNEIAAAVQQIAKTVDGFTLHPNSHFYVLDMDDWHHIHFDSTDHHVQEMAGVMLAVVADDLHDGNIMKRPSTGHVVIVDPAAPFDETD